MAKQTGIIKLQGALDGFVAYQLHGQWIIRRSSSPTKERIQSDPAFARVREINREFGGASTISKFIRTAWASCINADKDPLVHSRLNGKLLHYIKNGQGTKGQRTFQWGSITHFEPFNINVAPPVDTFLINFPQVDTANNWNIRLNDTQLQTFPQGATHFKLTLQLTELPHFTYNASIGKYTAPMDTPEVFKFETPVYPVDTVLSQSASMPIPSNKIWAYTLLITFYQNINNNHYPLKGHPFTWLAIV